MFGDKVEGAIIRYMFPCNGTITRAMIRLGNKPKNSIRLKIRLFNETNSISKGFVLEKKLYNIDPEIAVVAGDCLEVFLEAEDEIVTEIWVSLLWTPLMKDTEIKTFLIEDIENDLQKRTDALTAEEHLP
jgi:hypothetical protein